MGLCIDDNYIYFAYNANSVYGRRVAKYTKDLVFVAESANLPSPNIYGHVFINENKTKIYRSNI